MKKKILWNLIRLEAALDLRNKQTLYGVLLYAVMVAYALSLAFGGRVAPVTGIALLWIVLLFSGLQAAQRSAIGQSGPRFFTAVQWAGPREWALAKMIYQMVFQSILAAATWLIFKLWIEIEVNREWVFLPLIMLGSSAFAATTTFMASIASRSQISMGLIGILSIPLMLPILLTGVSGSVAITQSEAVEVSSYFGALGGLNGVVLILGYLLFPYLWND